MMNLMNKSHVAYWLNDESYEQQTFYIINLYIEPDVFE
jgi:hypothetical protein